MDLRGFPDTLAFVDTLAGLGREEEAEDSSEPLPERRAARDLFRWEASHSFLSACLLLRAQH